MGSEHIPYKPDHGHDYDDHVDDYDVFDDDEDGWVQNTSRTHLIVIMMTMLIITMLLMFDDDDDHCVRLDIIPDMVSIEGLQHTCWLILGRCNYDNDVDSSDDEDDAKTKVSRNYIFLFVS